MCGKTTFLVFNIFLLSLIMTSCGGGASNIASTALVEPALVFAGAESQIPLMPPGGDFNPARITAAVTAQRNGAIAYDHNPANVTLPGPHAAFTPALGDLAWAIYEFPGSSADDISAVEYFVSNRPAGALVWMAISNYTTDAWDFLGSRNLDHGTFNPSGAAGEYASEAGHTYVMVLAWDGTSFDLDQVTVTYANRYAVTGQVVDMAGVGIPMATVTTSLGGPGVVTDAAGNFTLPAIPEGTWHIMATKPAWAFYDNPQEFTVSGGPLSGVQIIGDMNQSHFEPIEDSEPNDAWWEAPNMDPSTPVEEFISVSDDPADFYRFTITMPGPYWFRLEADPNILFPHLTLFTKEGLQLMESSWVGSGVVYVPFAVAATRVVIVEVSCSGGGGMYNLSTGTGDLNKLEGHVEINATDHIDYVEIQCDAAGEITNLYSFSGNGNFLNNYMKPANTMVTPDPSNIDPYDYMPLNFMANLNMGDVICPDFVGSGVFLVDPYEPNDTKAAAYHFAAMPVAGVMCNISGATSYDWYKVSPAAGKHLIARVVFDYAADYWSSSPISITMENETATEYSYGFKTNDGLELRTSNPCDGGDYYIQVTTFFTTKRIHFYTLWIEEVDAYKLEVGGLWKTESNSFGLENARIDIYSPEYNWVQTFQTAHSGLTEIPFLFKDGEALFAEIFRYGTTIDRNTKHFTIAGEDIKSWFVCNADECEDSWESNDEYGKHVDYPADFDATISSDSDPVDSYLVTPVALNTLHVGITTPDDGLSASINFWNNTTDTWLENREVIGSGDYYFEVTPGIEYKVELSCWMEEESPYHIIIDEVPGFKLQGTLLDNVASMVPYSYIYCPALDYQFIVYPWAVDGNYELGPFPPGTYQIYAYGANHDPAPGSPWTLNVAGADVVQDFVLNPSYTDVGEPNNTWFTASGPLVTGVPVDANINSDSDSADYWSFTVLGAGLINSYITFEKGFGDPNLTLFDVDGTTELMDSSLTGGGYERIDYYLPAAGTYFLLVDTWGGANDYTVAVNY